MFTRYQNDCGRLDNFKGQIFNSPVENINLGTQMDLCA